MKPLPLPFLSFFAPSANWLLGLCLFGSNVLAAPADDVKALLEQGKDKEAYDAGKGAPDALGTPLFDFYFGIAALNAGVPGEGVLALERYLLQFPDNRSALFQLARGYFILGEDERAREEFTGLVAGAAGNDLNNINQFLDAIRSRESRYKPTTSAYIEVGGGYDSNLNSGIAAGQVAGLPLGVVIASGQTSERQADFSARLPPVCRVFTRSHRVFRSMAVACCRGAFTSGATTMSLTRHCWACKGAFLSCRVAACIGLGWTPPMSRWATRPTST